jgi:fatty-acid desaturase
MNQNPDKPWTRPWYYTHPDGRTTFYYLIVIHLMALGGLILLPLPSIWVILGMAFFAFLGALGTTVVYHRTLTHRGVKIHPAVEQTLIFFTVFGGVGAPRAWVANHRYHHAMSDTPDDVSSPYFGGFWWAHLRWLWQCPQSPMKRFCPELAKPRYIFWEKAQPAILAVSVFFGLIFSPAAWLWLGPIRMLWALHGQCSVNSVCHLGRLNRENPGPRGSAINVWWLTPIFLGIGENWHGNHHEDQFNPRLGLKPGQVDIGWWTIVALKKVGLASYERFEKRERASLNANSGPASETAAIS